MTAGDARAEIMARIEAALGRAARPAEAEIRPPDAVVSRLAAAAPNLIPARGRRDARGRLELFKQMAEEAAATVTVLQDAAAVPAAVAGYLKNHNIAGAVRLAPDFVLRALPWTVQSMLEVSDGVARPDDAVSVTRAFAGIAETGTLVLRSGADSPVTLSFLPETNIVVLAAADLFGAYEEAWTRLRDEPGGGWPPRMVNWITGPSRTGDIEQKLMLGVHGPRRLHILVIEAGGGDG